jgi:lipopolysaccharide export system protein LptC
MDRRWWMLLLAIGVGLSWWLAISVDKPKGRLPEMPKEVDAFMEDFDALQVDARGRREQRLVAAYSEHFPRDDSSELTEPRLTLFQALGPPWEVRAARAWVGAHGDLIKLFGNVVVRRPKGPTNEALEVRTEQLLVRPEDGFAQTDLAVEIETESGLTTGVGMRAYLHEKLYQILSRARGRYDSQPIPNP